MIQDLSRIEHAIDPPVNRAADDLSDALTNVENAFDAAIELSGLSLDFVRDETLAEPSGVNQRQANLRIRGTFYFYGEPLLRKSAAEHLRQFAARLERMDCEL